MHSATRRIDLVSIRPWLFAISGISALIGIVLLLIPPSLKPGIEFTAGSTELIQFEKSVDQAALREVYAAHGHADARIQSTGTNEFLIRTRELKAPAGSFSEVTPETTATPGVGLGTLHIGKEGATGTVTLHAATGGDPCHFGVEAGDVPAGTQANVLERQECGGGDDVVYRVQAGTLTGYVRAGDTTGFTPAPASATPAASGTPAATGTPGGTATATATATAAVTGTAGASPTAEGSPAASATAPAGAAGAAATPTPPVPPGERGEIETALRERFGNFDVKEFATVSAVVSKAAVRNAAAAVIISSLFIMGYIAFAFSSVPRPLRYGTCAIVATLHDVIIVLGVFSLLGKVFGVEINLMFVTGLLTIIGFSVHDTIVVFDRIRENVRLAPNAPLEDNVNAALVQTLGRSLNTSLTVLLTVLALLLLGGVTIQSFLLVLFVGILSGTYSSVGIAAQLLVSWENGDFGRLFNRLRGRRRAEAAP